MDKNENIIYTLNDNFVMSAVTLSNFQPYSQKILLRGSFNGNADLLLLQQSTVQEQSKSLQLQCVLRYLRWSYNSKPFVLTDGSFILKVDSKVDLHYKMWILSL